MSLITSLKNLRRRTVESVFQKVGISEVTVDKEFDLMNHETKEVLADLNECGAGLAGVLKQQKLFFGEARELTNVVHTMYEKSLNENEVWLEDTNRLTHFEAVSVWKEKWDNLHDVVRSSSAIICCEESLNPIRDAITDYTPVFEQDTKDRAAILIDLDSFRRRLKVLENKRSDAVSIFTRLSTSSYQIAIIFYRFYRMPT